MKYLTNSQGMVERVLNDFLSLMNALRNSDTSLFKEKMKIQTFVEQLIPFEKKLNF